MNIEDKVFNILKDPIKGIGFKIIYIKQNTKGSKKLQIIAERNVDQKLDINDCVKISKFATVLLENEESINFDFGLEVSSPGVDRLLIKIEDYKNFKGNMVNMIFSKDLGHKLKISGILTDVTKNNMIRIKSNDEKFTIPFDSVYECRIIPKI
tara:strand:+ start:578 stop:1036 length:459 start_codon:yes stop_codon:yes gene_type:complete